MMDEVNTDPLESLRREWEDEKSPKLSLQLAEEYGRREDYLSAINVLRTGLAGHPHHVASKVLLARYLVELEQWPEARDLLEGVASTDPTHLIANKLLVKTHLATGDPAEARNRLDLYTLLNESDPEIEELERAVGGGSTTEAPAAAASEPGSAIAEDRAEAAEDEQPKEPPRAEPAGAVEDVPLVAGSEPEPATAVPETTDPFAPPPAGDEPFGDLFGVAARGRVEAPPVDDIFEIARPAAAPEPVEDLALPVVEEPTEPVEDLAGSVEEPGEAVADLTVSPEEAAGAAEALAHEGESRLAVDAADTAGETEEAEEGAAGPPATVSLGQLYLQQGHREDAEETFLAVLEREPENAAARTGLAAARGASDSTLTALDLVSRDTLSAASPTERKRAVLSGYLERLRLSAGG